MREQRKRTLILLGPAGSLTQRRAQKARGDGPWALVPLPRGFPTLTQLLIIKEKQEVKRVTRMEVRNCLLEDAWPKGGQLGGQATGQVIAPSLPSPLTTISVRPGTPVNKVL